MRTRAAPLSGHPTRTCHIRTIDLSSPSRARPRNFSAKGKYLHISTNSTIALPTPCQPQAQPGSTCSASKGPSNPSLHLPPRLSAPQHALRPVLVSGSRHASTVSAVPTITTAQLSCDASSSHTQPSNPYPSPTPKPAPLHASHRPVVRPSVALRNARGIRLRSRGRPIIFERRADLSVAVQSRRCARARCACGPS